MPRLNTETNELCFTEVEVTGFVDNVIRPLQEGNNKKAIDAMASNAEQVLDLAIAQKRAAKAPKSAFEALKINVSDKVKMFRELCNGK